MVRKQATPNVSFFAFQDIITSVVGIFILITIIMLLEMANRTVLGLSSGRQSTEAQSSGHSAMSAEVKTLENRLEELKQVASSVGTSKPMTSEEKRKDIEKQISEIEARLKRFSALQQQTSRAILAAETTLRQLQEVALNHNEKADERKKLLDQLAFLRAELDSLKDDDPLVFRDEQLQGKTVVVIDFDSTETRVLKSQMNARLVFSGNDRSDQWARWAGSQNLASMHFHLMLRPGGNVPYNNARPTCIARMPATDLM